MDHLPRRSKEFSPNHDTIETTVVSPFIQGDCGYMGKWTDNNAPQDTENNARYVPGG